MAKILVRDRIRDIPGFKVWGSHRGVKNIEEHQALLLKKIHEELGELIEADQIGYSDEVNEEAADVLQAIMDFAHVRTGIAPEQLLRRVTQKREERGGFLGGLVWEHP